MKNKKIYHCRTSKTGMTTPVTLQFTKYGNNTLAVQLVQARPPYGCFATITTNLQGNYFWMDVFQSETQAYVDTNNYPWVEEFLLDNEIAKKTPVQAPSGFCIYPLYVFDKNKVYEEMR